MKKKMLGLLVLTMVLGTVCTGCKEPDKVSVNGDNSLILTYNSEEASYEKAPVEEEVLPGQVISDEELAANWFAGEEEQVKGYVIAEAEDHHYEQFDYAGNAEVGYFMPSEYMKSWLYGYHKAGYSYQDYLDTFKAIRLKDVNQDIENCSLTENKGDGYVEYVYVDNSLGDCGETHIYRYYDLEDAVCVLEFSYWNDEEETILERIKNSNYFMNHDEIRKYIDEIQPDYIDVQWFEEGQKVEF